MATPANRKDPRLFILYGVCLVLLILGILKFFMGLPIIGFLIAFATLGIAGCGAAGGYFNSFKLLWLFMVGLIPLMLLGLIEIIIDLVGKKGHFSRSLLVDIFLLLVYVGGFVVGYLLRGRTFQFRFINLDSKQSLPNNGENV
eukprot:TRINITY_DN17541_c0_g1_i1.p1 TRINITY_DN17541_c0_g1~~TRINITY_DN17541_c0_g1_i1.p1  ORF type:complete len:143 (+),score=18.21 TRINITY_DN17541_c0_g1_i1:86-514(+)